MLMHVADPLDARRLWGGSLSRSCGSFELVDVSQLRLQATSRCTVYVSLLETRKDW